MDLDGRFKTQFPFFVEFLKSSKIRDKVLKDARIMPSLTKFGEQKAKYFREALLLEKGPRIVPTQLNGMHGFTPNNSATSQMFQIEIRILKKHHWSKVCETTFMKLPSQHPIRKDRPAITLNSILWEELITTTLLHELVHFANHDKGVFPPESDERGFKFEAAAGLNTPSIPDSEIEDLDFWAKHNSISNPLFPIPLTR